MYVPFKDTHIPITVCFSFNSRNSPAAASVKRLISVLHVEPDVGMRTFLKQRLEEADPGFAVVSVASAVDALTGCTRNKIDLILINHSPLLNAFELTKTLKGVTSAPIVIYSVEGEENISNSALDVGADAYVVVSMSLVQAPLLAKRLRVIVDKRRGVDLAAAILDAGGNAVAVEYEGKIIYFNPAFERLVSGTAEELTGVGFSAFVPETEQAKTQGLLKTGGETALTIVTLKGERRTCRVWISLSPLLGREATVVLLQDTTEASLHEQRLRSLHEHAPKILKARTNGELAKFTLDAVEASFDSEVISFMLVEGEALVCLERRWRASGLRVPLSGGSLLAVCAREGRPVTTGGVSNGAATIEDIAIKSELSAPIKNGDAVVAILDLRSSRANAFPEADVRAIENLCLYAGCTYRLISELESITSSETQFRSLLEALGEAVYVLVDSRYAYVNKSGAELLGYTSPSDVVGKDVFIDVAPEYREALRGRLENQHGEGATDTFEMKLIKRNGSSIFIEVNASWIVFEGKPAYLAIAKDVTSNKLQQEQINQHTTELEKQVEKRTQELLEAQQFAAAGRMASMVGHDLRSPLQSIRNATYLMRRQPERIEEMLNGVEVSVDRALSMLEDLRYRTRETPLKLESIDLPELIVDILKEAPVAENIAVDVRLDPQLKVVTVDSLKLRRVVDNLVRNAIEAMPSGGRLTVEAKSDGDKFAILVSDTGVGIAQDHFSKLFKPFYTTKAKGLGLGLAYSLKAVEAHGGTIEVESKVGVGTVFKILLTKNPVTRTLEAKD